MKKRYSGLIGSVLKTGDGKTQESAFVTISVDEEYAILYALGLQRRSQSLVGNRDRFLVTNDSGDEHVIFFFSSRCPHLAESGPSEQRYSSELNDRFW